MKTLPLNFFDPAEDFNLKAISSVEELTNHDLIYIYHHLGVGSEVLLEASGTNIKGDIRYKVSYKGFVIGFTYLGGYFKSYYENNNSLVAKIIGLRKEKYLPIREMDLEVDLIRLKNVS